jgi:hypothetical protein
MDTHFQQQGNIVAITPNHPLILNAALELTDELKTTAYVSDQTFLSND